MGFTFTDTEIKELSLTTKQLPFIIDNPAKGSGLIQQKEKFVTQRADILELDEQNKIFTDFWTSVIQSYHNELGVSNGLQGTSYSEPILVNGAQGNVPHYTEVWPNTVPILIPSVIGQPFTNAPGLSEKESIELVNEYVTKLISGFGGSFSDNTDAGYTAGDGQFVMNSGSLAPGTLIIIDSGGSSMLALVGTSSQACSNGVSPDAGSCVIALGVWETTYLITPISPDISFSSGARVRDFHSGFTNGQRGGQGVSNYAVNVQTFFEDSIDSAVTSWLSANTTQISEITDNADILTINKANNAIAVLNSGIPTVTLTPWSVIPKVSTTGRFTDTNIGTLTTTGGARLPIINSRITEVLVALGTPTQSGDGTVTGDGSYNSLYIFISIRIAKAGGTLYGWYTSALALGFFDVKIANAQNQLTQLENTFAIGLIVGDTSVSQISFTLDSASVFQVGEQIKVMDNDSIVYTRTINGITGNDVELSSGIPSQLTEGSIARFVRVN